MIDKKAIRTLHATTRAMTKDMRKLKASLAVLNALSGLSTTNGEIFTAAHLEAVAAIRALKINMDQIAAALGEPVVASTDNGAVPF